MRFSFHEPQSFVQKGTIDFHFLSMSHKVLFKKEQSNFQFLSMSHNVLFKTEKSATQFCPSATKFFSPGKKTLQSFFPQGKKLCERHKVFFPREKNFTKFFSPGKLELINNFSTLATIKSVGLYIFKGSALSRTQ